MADVERILVIGPAWVGDMVMAQSLFAALRHQHPLAAIDVLAPRWTLPLLSFMPEIRRAIEQPLGHGELGLATRRRQGRELRAARYDLALVLPGSLKAALVPLWASIPRRRGYGGTLRHLLLNDVRRKSAVPQIESFLALADWDQAAPEPRLVLPPDIADQALGLLGLSRPGEPLLAIAPGAEYGPAKRWPARHFAAVAEAKRKEGWQVWLFGSPGDREIATTIACDQNLAGRTSLDQAVALMSLADVVLSNDSGLMHVAAALQRPQLALFGPSDPRRTGPRSTKAQVLRLGLDCSPCNMRVCPLGHHRCLEDLSPAMVLRLLAESGRGSAQR
ncbi:MAG TPA: lipopolysaccharide heptosyltransferase II [Candidatus Polarisedimenticolia bacterium]|nr:lipopolysaccharide heptosyltransferase II [Candidatus Polarisedimenticolia bacterium]